jgi:hypothetical protein
MRRQNSWYIFHPILQFKESDMKFSVHSMVICSLLAVLILTACAPQQTEAVPTTDAIGTLAAELAFNMMTQTAVAQPTATLPPTETPEPIATELPTLPPEPVETTMPVVYGSISGKEPCYKGGPGPNREVTSYITDTKKVEMIGIGSVPGWYVIEDPYFYSPCWINAENLILESDFDLSAYPVIEP